MWSSRNTASWIFCGLTALISGCSTVRITDPPRTATEQFLLSEAASEAVDGLNFSTLRGRAVWVEDSYFAASEAEFVLGQMRAKMLMEGVRLAPTREECEVVVEVRSGGVGIDRYGFLLGAAASILPSSVLTSDSDDGYSVPIATPELSVLKNVDQRAVAGVSYVAYWRDTGEIVAASGPYVGRAFRDDWWYFGIGPKSRGDIPPVDEGRDAAILRSENDEDAADSGEDAPTPTADAEGEPAPEPPPEADGSDDD
ncbi:MAG TPA: DUF6655 family protein [Phycisphaerales bacterium]|nr:DUF6655 family protein [Phycisphaerales bacterium]